MKPRIQTNTIPKIFVIPYVIVQILDSLIFLLTLGYLKTNWVLWIATKQAKYQHIKK